MAEKAGRMEGAELLQRQVDLNRRAEELGLAPSSDRKADWQELLDPWVCLAPEAPDVKPVISESDKSGTSAEEPLLITQKSQHSRGPEQRRRGLFKKLIPRRFKKKDKYETIEHSPCPSDERSLGSTTYKAEGRFRKLHDAADSASTKPVVVNTPSRPPVRQHRDTTIDTSDGVELQKAESELILPPRGASKSREMVQPPRLRVQDSHEVEYAASSTSEFEVIKQRILSDPTATPKGKEVLAVVEDHGNRPSQQRAREKEEVELQFTTSSGTHEFTDENKPAPTPAVAGAIPLLTLPTESRKQDVLSRLGPLLAAEEDEDDEDLSKIDLNAGGGSAVFEIEDYSVVDIQSYVSEPNSPTYFRGFWADFKGCQPQFCMRPGDEEDDEEEEEEEEEEEQILDHVKSVIQTVASVYSTQVPVAVLPLVIQWQIRTQKGPLSRVSQARVAPMLTRTFLVFWPMPCTTSQQ